MPFISNFFDYFKRRIKVATCGNRLRDKFILFICSMIDSFPMTIRRRSPILHGKMWALSRMLMKHVAVDVNRVKYALVDSASVLGVSSAYEPWMFDYLRPNPGDVFIDVGAARGRYALSVAKTVGKDGLVIAIEPNPENYQALLRSVELNGFRNVVVLNIAAWNKNCRLKLFLSHRSGWSSVKRSHWGAGCIEVEARALDEVVEELDVNRVDWVKIDVEGAEVEVLQGLKKTLTKWHPKIIVEVLEENRQAFLDFISTLAYKATSIEGSKQVCDFYCE